MIQLDRLKAEADRRESTTTQIKAGLFDKQLAVINDPSMLRAVLGSRRIGKSYMIGSDLLITCIDQPGCSALYLALTGGTATNTLNRHILSPLMQKLDIKATWHNTEKAWKFANGSILYLRGGSGGMQALDRIVGQKFSGTCFIDECGSQPRVEAMVYEKVLLAAAEGGGKVCIVGTPGLFPDGLFHKATHGLEPGWKSFHWTWQDNPHVAYGKMKTTHDELIKNNPNIVHTPGYKREWLGQWVVDDSELVYTISPKSVFDGGNMVEALPTGLDERLWHYGLGVDLGYVDATAFVIVAWHEHDPHLYVIRSYEIKGKLPSDWEAETRRWWKAPDLGSYGKYPLDFMVIDTGGLGLAIVEEMRQRKNMPWDAASKVGKLGNIEMLNSELKQQLVLFLPDARGIVEQAAKLPWHVKTKNGRKLKEENPSAPNHQTDALLYAFLASKNYYASDPPKPPPSANTPEYSQAHMLELIEKNRQRAQDPFSLQQQSITFNQIYYGRNE